jgi:hypothetical protein
MNMKNTVLNAIRSTKGRFFGLHTIDGRSINAQLIKETPSYVRVLNRNTKENVLVSKNNINYVTFQGVMFS